MTRFISLHLNPMFFKAIQYGLIYIPIESSFRSDSNSNSNLGARLAADEEMPAGKDVRLKIDAPNLTRLPCNVFWLQIKSSPI